MNIYVGNISFDTTEDQLRDLFSPFGEIKSASVVKDKFTGRSRGFGFVEMAERGDGEKAIEQLHNSSFGNRSIVVNEARPKTNEGRSSSFSRGGGRDRY